jgi:hypothetical protein
MRGCEGVYDGEKAWLPGVPAHIPQIGSYGKQVLVPRLSSHYSLRPFVPSKELACVGGRGEVLQSQQGDDMLCFLEISTKNTGNKGESHPGV